MMSDIDYQYPDKQSTQVDFSKAHDLTAYNDQTVKVGNTDWVKFGTFHYAKNYSENPDMSPLLVKTRIGDQGQKHGGGHYWTSDDADYKAIRQWIAEGAQNN